MSDRFFLDTNVFVYSFDSSEPRKAAKANQIIRSALVTGKGLISYQIVQEFFNLALRRFTSPMQPADAEQYLRTVLQPLVAVHSSVPLYDEALRLYGKRGLSWYDALIVAAAIRTGCRELLTEDMQHGQKFGTVEIVNPFR